MDNQKINVHNKDKPPKKRPKEVCRIKSSDGFVTYLLIPSPGAQYRPLF